jgi:hypothetical protein
MILASCNSKLFGTRFFFKRVEPELINTMVPIVCLRKKKKMFLTFDTPCMLPAVAGYDGVDCHARLW